MKFFFLLMMVFGLDAWSQDPKSTLALYDQKLYSLKTKGVKDFTVEIDSSRLTKQVNDQLIFGKVNKLVFKLYWTLNPERTAIEVEGLPDGFKEVKEELKLNIMAQIDHLIPPTTEARFQGYQFSAQGKDILAQDKTGIAPIPSYILKFDPSGQLNEVLGQKHVGTYVVKNQFGKESFADGKFVLKSQTTASHENGQMLTVVKNFSYGNVQGIGVLKEIEIVLKQKWDNPKMKSNDFEETLSFRNYKINTGEALKYFMGDSSQKK